MANPQPDEFTRLSNELLEAIMFSNFTKRQLNIIFLVIRLSYGCGKKYALIKKSEFEVVGVYKTDVKRELEYLEATKVIKTDGDQVFFNKNYDQWRINLVYTINQKKYIKLLGKNIPQKVSKTLTDEEEKVSETLTDSQLFGRQNTNLQPSSLTAPRSEGKSKCFTNCSVSKTLTERDTQPYGPNGCRAPKERVKKDLKDLILVLISEFEKEFGRALTPAETNKMTAWQEKFSDELIREALACAVLQGKRSMAYVGGILRNWQQAGITTAEEARQTQDLQPKKRSKGSGGANDEKHKKLLRSMYLS